MCPCDGVEVASRRPRVANRKPSHFLFSHFKHFPFVASCQLSHSHSVLAISDYFWLFLAISD